VTALTPPAVPAPRRGLCLKGRCLGLLRSSKGKVKGLRLATASGDRLLAVDKYVGYALHCEVEPGMLVRVWARQNDGELEVVMAIPLEPKLELALPTALEAAEPRQRPTTLQVCRKGSCHKRGSSQVWQALSEALATIPDCPVQLEATGCQKQCKQGPALRITSTGKQYERVTPETAVAIARSLLPSHA